MELENESMLPSKSSHVMLRWLSASHGSAPGTLVDMLSAFAREVLQKYEQVDGRTEVARNYRSIKPSDEPWMGIEKVEIFLRQIKDNPGIMRYLGTNHHFVLAVLPSHGNEPAKIVGAAQFVEGPKKKLLGQFTCVHPEFQRMRIMEKMHRAIQGFGRKYGYKVYEADLSSTGSVRAYERMRNKPRVRIGRMPKQGVTERIDIRYPKKNVKKNVVPHVKVRIFPLLRRRRK